MTVSPLVSLMTIKMKLQSRLGERPFAAGSIILRLSGVRRCFRLASMSKDGVTAGMLMSIGLENKRNGAPSAVYFLRNFAKHQTRQNAGIYRRKLSRARHMGRYSVARFLSK